MEERSIDQGGGIAGTRPLIHFPYVVAAAMLFVGAAAPAWSQVPGSAPSSQQQLGPLPPKLPQLPPAPPPPRAPELEVPTPAPPTQPGEAITAPKIFIKDIRLTGNTA